MISNKKLLRKLNAAKGKSICGKYLAFFSKKFCFPPLQLALIPSFDIGGRPETIKKFLSSRIAEGAWK